MRAAFKELTAFKDHAFIYVHGFGLNLMMRSTGSHS